MSARLTTMLVLLSYADFTAAVGRASASRTPIPLSEIATAATVATTMTMTTTPIKTHGWRKR